MITVLNVVGLNTAVKIFMRTEVGRTREQSFQLALQHPLNLTSPPISLSHLKCQDGQQRQWLIVVKALTTRSIPPV